MEDDFRNLTTKVWANLDNLIKRYDFSKVSLILCMSPSQVTLFQYLWCHIKQNYLMELYTNLYKISLFMKMHLPSSFNILRSEMIVHALNFLWLNLIKRTKSIDIQEKLKIVKIYVQGQGQWSLGELSSCESQILAEFSPERATYATLYNHFS